MLFHRTLNVEDYLSILKRRWWIIAVPAIVLPICAVGATYFVTPEYVSSTTVLVDSQKVSGDYVRSLATEPLDTRLAYIQTKVESRVKLEPIITKYNLYADQHLSMDAKIDLIRSKVKISPVQSDLARSNGLPGFSISFTASDPHTAQQVCTDVTALFTSENVKSREDKAEESTNFLQERLDAAKRTLDDQDKKKADFEQQHMGALPGDTNGNIGVMSSLNSQLDATTQSIQTLQQNRSMTEALLAAQQTPSTPSGVPAARTPQAEQVKIDELEARKAALLETYTSEYPAIQELDRQINVLRADMARSAANPTPATPAAPVPNRTDSINVVQLKAQLAGLNAQIEAKTKDQNQLQRQIQAYEGKIQASPQIEEQYTELTRDYDTDLASYNSLKSGMNSAAMTTDLERSQEGETFSLLDEATLPTDPIFPKVPAFAAGGFAGGIVFGLAIIALLEYKDTALRTEAEVWDFVQLPTLAVIAWSGGTADLEAPKRGFIKRLFSRKPTKDMLAGAQG